MPSASPRSNGRPSMSTSSPSLPSTAAAASADDSRSSTPTPSRPSFLSRLSLPLTLRNRNRHVADFHVRPDEPHKSYSAGKHVRGAVVLAIVKPVRITHLVVSLHGYVHVVKDPVAMAKTQPVTPRGGSSVRPQYHGNGLASLFQDEQVLSGEGRLEAGKYEFGFDLVFPDAILPSSIDFERGTISYMITATLTRPTPIAPTTSCDRKVILVEHVDIGCLSPPRPRTIFLEPISKQRTRRKKSVALEKTPPVVPDPLEVVSESESVARSASNEDSTRDASPSEVRSPVQSDMRSEVSGGSGRSAGSVVSRAEFAQLSQVGTTFTSAKQQVVDDKTITATIELVKGGCLPGDTVTVRVTVQHIKLIKSMTGVIVTLFRQGKIDTAPPQHKFDESLGKFGLSRTQKEDPYPKSRLGLGGLSLSSTSSTSVFRKDLDQNTAPLIIDPSTMQASVTVSVKVPDDSFPTIKGVPGDMVSFKYQVEVIVDLGGRLSSQMQSGQTPARFGTFHSNTTEQGSASFGPRRPVNIADTALLRRGKGVVTVSMETIVGSVDSSKTPKPRAPATRTIKIAGEEEDDDLQPDIGPPSEMPRDGSSGGFNGQPPVAYNASSPNDQPYYSSPPPLTSPGQRPPLPPSQMASEQPYLPPVAYPDEATPLYVPPPPDLPDQNNLTDKERMRQAELRLLPSQPPAIGGPSSAPSDIPNAPSAPDEDIYDADQVPRSAPYDVPPPLDNAGGENEPSAPVQDDVSIATVTEDKQERERQRLLREASAPPEVPNDMDRRSDRTVGREDTANAEPSAPVLDDDNDNDLYSGYGVGAGPSGSRSSQHAEQLPAYER